MAFQSLQWPFLLNRVRADRMETVISADYDSNLDPLSSQMTSQSGICLISSLMCRHWQKIIAFKLPSSLHSTRLVGMFRNQSKFWLILWAKNPMGVDTRVRSRFNSVSLTNMCFQHIDSIGKVWSTHCKMGNVPIIGRAVVVSISCLCNCGRPSLPLNMKSTFLGFHTNSRYGPHCIGCYHSAHTDPIQCVPTQCGCFCIITSRSEGSPYYRECSGYPRFYAMEGL